MLTWNKEGREIMAAAEIDVPQEMYRGCGAAWVALNDDGEIVAVRYMADHPEYMLSDYLRETGRKRCTYRAMQLHRAEESRRFGLYRDKCRAELALLGHVVSGDMSGTCFYPAEAVNAAVAATLR
jgi:hypothetical protein